MEAVYNVFEQAKDACAKMSVDGNDLARGCLAHWGLPFDTWRRVASSMSLFPGDRLQAFKWEDARHVGDTLHANLQRFLPIPPVGIHRERQELGQQAMQAWLEYQQAQSHYMGVVAKVGGRTLELTQHKLVEMASAGKRIESLRQFYDL
jgi:class III poly(R)-hydroxyalkanoic acid synthase PhaE subunit